MSQAQDHSWFAYLHVRDAADLYHECLAHGVDIWHSLADKPWGLREFAIVTPDGHRIVFGERLTAAEPPLHPTGPAARLPESQSSPRRPGG